MVKLKWYSSARIDLIQIYSYIYQDSVYYSIKTINNIIDLVDNLKYLPYMGRKIPEFDDKNRRELIYKSYRIMYSIESNIILIRRIWHSKRKVTKELLSWNLNSKNI